MAARIIGVWIGCGIVAWLSNLGMAPTTAAPISIGFALGCTWAALTWRSA